MGGESWIDRVEDIKLKSPDDIGSVFDIARLLEAFEGDALSVTGAIKTADDDESGIGISLELFKLANGVINAKFGRFLAGRNNLEIVKADDRCLLSVEAKRLEANEKLINRFVLHFQDLQIGLRVSDFVNDAIELSRPEAAPNISGS